MVICLISVNSGSDCHYQFENPLAAQRAANLIGISIDELTHIIFETDVVFGTVSQCSLESALYNLESLVIAMYNEVVSVVVSLINNSICTRNHSINSILLVDSPGIQNLSRCGINNGASLEDLIYNYLQERLHNLFCQNTLVAPRIRYAQELVDIDQDVFRDSPQGHLIALLDKPPPNNINYTSKSLNKSLGEVGIFWLLDETTQQSDSSEETFLHRLFTNYGSREYQSILSRGNEKNEFILHHLQGTNSVLYCVNDWLKLNKFRTLANLVPSLLQKSKKIEIQKLFSMCGLSRITTYNGASAATLRKCSSVQTITSCGNNNKSNIIQVIIAFFIIQ